MAADAAHFFEAFFRELTRRGIPFAILHHYEQMPEQMASDVDFAVRHEDLTKLLAVQQDIARRQGWVLASVVHAKLSAEYAVFFDPADASRMIQLDACGHYIERRCFVLRDTQLLTDARTHRFFKVAAPAAEFGYSLAKALLKGKRLELYLPRLRELWQADPAGAEACFKALAPQTGKPLRAWFSRPAVEWEQTLGPLLQAHTRFGLVNLAREFVRVARRILHPVGMHIVILGPDGVGKSTLIPQLRLPCFHELAHYHFRPGVLGKRSPGATTAPHAQPPRSGAVSLVKRLYYFADHWLGYVGKIFPAKVRNNLVVFDRSFADLLVDPRRYRLSPGNGVTLWLQKLLPPPDLTIVLDADPEVVHARKPELEMTELRRQREALRRFAAATRGCVVVSATETAEQVARTVQNHMVNYLAAREQRRQRP